MEILVLDYLVKQTLNKKHTDIKTKGISPAVVSKIYQEIEQLEKIQSLGYSSLRSYLKTQNGKEMKGSEYIWKYRLNDGDRILYTYGKHLDYIRKEDKDSLVIVAYAKHDEQGDINLPPKQDYYNGKEILRVFKDIGITAQDLADMQMEDLEAFEQILSAEFTKFHTLYVVSTKEYEDRDPNSLDVYLTDEQKKYINEYMDKKQPLLVLGGAGTGKTVMATHILADYKMQNPDTHCIYFTQSRELLSTIQKKYLYISHNNYVQMGKDATDEDTLFFNINDYCRSKLGLLERNFVQTEQFLEYIRSNHHIMEALKKADIEPLDLWAEIRGTIKGSLDENWRRVTPRNRLEYDKEVIDELDNAGILHWEKNGKNFTLIADCEIPMNLSDDASKILQGLIKYFNSVDCTAPLINKDRYMTLKPELSTLSPEHRELAYKLCEAYQTWLGDDKYDENDLIRLMLGLNSLDVFDMAVVDEIQDYTEMQIFLLHKLVKDDSYLVMAGDGHQNVNPTVFSERRLYALVENRLMERELQKTFRCKKPIVKCANALGTLRKQFIAKKDERLEYSESEGEVPFFLKYNSENERMLLSTLAGYPNTAILVPDERDKNRLNQFIHSTVADAPDIVFTVAEIKGMEYRYVVCYNLIGCYNEVWNQIIIEKKAKYQTRYRYYFNLFYVGITRTQDYLCILEPEGSSVFFELLENTMGIPFDRVSDFDEIKLHISDLTNSVEEMIKQAQKYEESGKYEQAIQWYRKAEVDDSVIKRCELKLAIEKRDYVTAAEMAILINDRDMAVRILPELSDDELAKLLSIWIKLDRYTSANGYDGSFISRTINTYFSEENRESIMRSFIELLDLGFDNIMTNITEV